MGEWLEIQWIVNVISCHSCHWSKWSNSGDKIWCDNEWRNVKEELEFWTQNLQFTQYTCQSNCKIWCCCWQTLKKKESSICGFPNGEIGAKGKATWKRFPASQTGKAVARPRIQLGQSLNNKKHDQSLKLKQIELLGTAWKKMELPLQMHCYETWCFRIRIRNKTLPCI